MATTTRRRRSSYDLTPRWITGRRILIAVAAAVALVAGTYGVRFALALGHAFHQDPFSAVVNALGGGHGSSVDASRQNLRRINIVLYGYGGDGHDGAFLSDSIMLVSIQPEPHGPPAVAEVSIPRDWYVPIDLGHGRSARYGRINEAYADGMNGLGPVDKSLPNAGAAVADPTLQHLFGITIDHYVGVDFRAFASAVDAVGGIDVNVPNSFTDYQYPAGECDQGNCGYMTVHFNAGTQHLNGRQALIFARSRHGNNGEGSDFARSHRQQLIIAALRQKAVSLGGIGNLPDLLNALGDHVRTDLTISDVEALFSLVQGVSAQNIAHISLDDTNFLYDCGYPRNCGAFYLYAHDRSYRTLAHFIQNVFLPAAARAEAVPVTFYDASGRRLDASGRWSSVMGSLGVKCSDGGPVARQAATQVIDESGGQGPQTAKWLAAFFDVTVTAPQATAHASPSGTLGSASPAAAAPPRGVVVILGTAEEQAFLANPGVGS
jgi:polyisoprenyl-teichoic acid--peptidoglycan teichoic acid transferase